MRKKMENASLSICQNVQGECREIDTRGFMLKSRNTSDLLRIQEIISSMEGRAYTRDQVIERIIGFYGKFVPF